MWSQLGEGLLPMEPPFLFLIQECLIWLASLLAATFWATSVTGEKDRTQLTSNELLYVSIISFFVNRHSVAEAVLQTPLSLIN